LTRHTSSGVTSVSRSTSTTRLTDPDIHEQVRQQAVRIDQVLSYWCRRPEDTRLLVYETLRTGYLRTRETESAKLETGLL
jgi:hypothetical protein